MDTSTQHQYDGVFHYFACPLAPFALSELHANSPRETNPLVARRIGEHGLFVTDYVLCLFPLLLLLPGLRST